MRKALLLPRVSSKWSALVLVLCMAATTLLVPVALKLPTWVEAEIVLACWWAIWCCALSLALYKGWLVSHDFEKPSAPPPKHILPSLDVPIVADIDPVGCLIGILLVLLLPFIVAFVLEAAFALVFVVYFLVRGMLAQVANDRKGCNNRLALSVAYGLLWATIFTAPLAGLVWWVHRLAR